MVSPSLRAKPIERAARLMLAIKEVERRRPTTNLLNKRSRPHKEEEQPCCRRVRLSNQTVAIRHLCTVKHIASKFGVGYQELLDAVWEEEAYLYERKSA